MTAAEKKTCALIETALSGNKAFRQIEKNLYVVKQGSSYVMITVVPWGADKAIVRCVAQLVKGVALQQGLAQQLLALNAVLRFGSFAYVKEGSLILLLHSILGGETLDKEELIATIRDIALVADDWDDKIVDRFGGQTMQDLIEETAIAQILSKEPNAFAWETNN